MEEENTNTENTAAESTATETATAPEPTPAAAPEPTSDDGPKTRPGFLSVLCILTFIWNALVILIVGIVLAAGAAFLPEMLAPMFAGATGLLIGILVLAAATFYGALQMWKLKKMGFYVYVGATAVGIILPMVLGGGFSVSGLIVPVLFVVLYGLNLKHLS